jgi:RNA polymerase sigma factor (TIGR02999 family)
MSQGSSGLPREIIERAERGDAEARDALFALLYDELHRLAHSNVARARGAMTWNTTTLLHEAYLGLARREELQFPDENRFLGYAARVMRGLTVDAARRSQTEKRGGRLEITGLDGREVAPGGDSRELSRLSDALDELAGAEPALAELVDLKYFCGFSFEEIAALRGMTKRTVQRHWEKARLYLRDTLREGETP